MNLQQLNSTLPKSWLNINCNELNANTMNVITNLDVQDIDAVTTQTQNLLLDQNVVVGVPMVGFSLLYADNTDRINVASQSQPTQQIAYLSDIMLLSNEIISNDLSCNVKCNDGGVIEANINGNQRIVMTNTGYSSIRSNSVNTRIDIDSNGSIYWASNGSVVLYVFGSSTRIWSPNNTSKITIEDFNGIRINDAFYLPINDGTNAQVITTNGAGVTTWSTLPTPKIYGQYSATGAPVVISNTNVQNSLIPLGLGSLNILNMLPGNTYLLKCGGIFRDNIINTQFTLRLLSNLSTLFSSGLLTLPLILSPSTAWALDMKFTYINGTQFITNCTFSYSNGSDARGFTTQQVNNTFNPANNTFNLTFQFVNASVNNTITCNQFSITKIF